MSSTLDPSARMPHSARKLHFFPDYHHETTNYLGSAPSTPRPQSHQRRMPGRMPAHLGRSPKRKKQTMKNEAAVALGRLSHSRQSQAQSEASRRNGKAGGRPRTKSPYAPAQSITQVNRAIRHLGVELIRGDDGSYFYFSLLNSDVGQVGEEIYRVYLNQAGLARWVSDAEYAVQQHQEGLGDEGN